MYKKIIIEEIETDYLIYDDGRVYSLKTNRFLNGDKILLSTVLRII